MKKLLVASLLLASSVARADGMQSYVADDLHPLDSATQMALTARAALSNSLAVVLVRDGQVPLLKDKSDAIEAAQQKGVKFFVCDTDMRAYKSPTLPDGIDIVDTSTANPDAPHSTVERILAHVCRREGA